MVEKLYSFSLADEKVIERIFEDDNAAINHMILQRDDALPEHRANSNVYMIVVRGNITLQLDDQQPHSYPRGSILAIPYRTLMNVSNQNNEVAEIFVVKAPGPTKMT